MASGGSQERGPALVFITAVSIGPEAGRCAHSRPGGRKAFAAMGPCGSAPKLTPQIALEQISWIAVLCSASPAIRRLKGSMDAATAIPRTHLALGGFGYGTHLHLFPAV